MRMIQNPFFYRPLAAPESSHKPLLALAAASFGVGTTEYVAMGLLHGIPSGLELPWLGVGLAIVAQLSYGMELQSRRPEASALATPRSIR